MTCLGEPNGNFAILIARGWLLHLHSFRKEKSALLKTMASSRTVGGKTAAGCWHQQSIFASLT